MSDDDIDDPAYNEAMSAESLIRVDGWMDGFESIDHLLMHSIAHSLLAIAQRLGDTV